MGGGDGAAAQCSEGCGSVDDRSSMMAQAKEMLQTLFKGGDAAASSASGWRPVATASPCDPLVAPNSPLPPVSTGGIPHKLASSGPSRSESLPNIKLSSARGSAALSTRRSSSSSSQLALHLPQVSLGRSREVSNELLGHAGASASSDGCLTATTSSPAVSPSRDALAKVPRLC